MKPTPLIVNIFCLAIFLARSVSAADEIIKSKETENRTGNVQISDIRPKETFTFLGVDVSPIDPALTDQLALQPGVGLVVDHILPDSPAAAVLKPHDILTKLDDQILIEPHQFAVLVQMHKEGDEVSIAIVRQAKESVVSVKLGKRERVVSAFGEDGSKRFQEIPGGIETREAIGNPLTMVPPFPPGLAGDATFGQGVSVAGGTRVLRLQDTDGSLELIVNGDHPQRGFQLTARDRDGNVAYKGTISTPEERAALAPEIRKRLERLEQRAVLLPPPVRVDPPMI